MMMMMMMTWMTTILSPPRTQSHFIEITHPTPSPPQDIRTPGLDEALEQTAIREKGLLLSVVGAFFPLLANTKQAKVLFESEVRLSRNA